MGRTKTVEGQQDLIDVDTPEGRAAKRIARQYRRIREEHNEARTTMREKEADVATKLREAISDLGIQPKSDGSYHCVLDGCDITIPAPKNPPIKIKDAKDEDDEDDTESDKDE